MGLQKPLLILRSLDTLKIRDIMEVQGPFPSHCFTQDTGFFLAALSSSQ